VSLGRRLPAARSASRSAAFGVLAAILLGSCSGPQSTLDTAGRAADQIATLFWWMLGGAAMIWLGVMALAVYALRAHPDEFPSRKANLLIVGGGVGVTTVVLAALLIYGLWLMPGLVAAAPPGSLVISVSGERWWWRVRYEPPGEESFELANELRLPVGEPAELRLESPDVVHSFWVPALAGKVDMIPGRVNRVLLEPTRTGTFRGACAEYCGASHALMNFEVVVTERAEYERWLDAQAAPAAAPTGALAVRGAQAFVANGCGACHTVRGTPADGRVGPDLTHVASRLRIAAGVLPTGADAFARWVANTKELKPQVHMPAFGMLDEDEIAALAAYLEGLE